MFFLLKWISLVQLIGLSIYISAYQQWVLTDPLLAINVAEVLFLFLITLVPLNFPLTFLFHFLLYCLYLDFGSFEYCRNQRHFWIELGLTFNWTKIYCLAIWIKSYFPVWFLFLLLRTFSWIECIQCDCLKVNFFLLWFCSIFLEKSRRVSLNWLLWFPSSLQNSMSWKLQIYFLLCPT